MAEKHARKNAVARQRQQTGQGYQAALKEIRSDRQAHIAGLDREVAPEPVMKQPYDAPVPPALATMVQHHTARILWYLHEALIEGRYNTNCIGEWQRMTLYRLTDGLAHLQLMIGTIASYLKSSGTSQTQLERYLQVSDQRGVQEYLTPKASEHLAGLMGQPWDESISSGVWHRSGARLAERSREASGPSWGDVIEALLAGLHYDSDDPEGLDYLPGSLKAHAAEVAAILRQASAAATAPEGP